MPLFRPHIQVTELQAESLQQLMGSWLQYTANDCKRQIKAVIDVIASVKTIHKIKLEAFAIGNKDNWILLNN